MKTRSTRGSRGLTLSAAATLYDYTMMCDTAGAPRDTDSLREFL